MMYGLRITHVLCTCLYRLCALRVFTSHDGQIKFFQNLNPDICSHCKLSCSLHVNDIHTHTHTQTCKHLQTGSSHCSSFVYTLTFSQHLSYVLYTFSKRGPFSNWGPYCSFCYKSLVWMPKQTHTHTHTHKLVNTGKRGPPIVPLLFIL